SLSLIFLHSYSHHSRAQHSPIGNGSWYKKEFAFPRRKSCKEFFDTKQIRKRLKPRRICQGKFSRKIYNGNTPSCRSQKSPFHSSQIRPDLKWISKSQESQSVARIELQYLVMYM
ncbi:hypothetical protein PFISCL1PPCAC_26015, partial [Pristionchus fissidentatus]